MKLTSFYVIHAKSFDNYIVFLLEKGKQQQQPQQIIIIFTVNYLTLIVIVVELKPSIEDHLPFRKKLN